MSFSDELKESILKDKEFIYQLSERIVEAIARGPSSGREVVFENDRQYYTKHQLDRFQKAFLFLTANDEKFRHALRKVFSKYIDKPIHNPLTKKEMIERIMDFGPVVFQYRGKNCGFYASEVYAAMPEYTPTEILRMLKEHNLYIKSSQKKHSVTRRFVRTLILDLEINR